MQVLNFISNKVDSAMPAIKAGVSGPSKPPKNMGLPGPSLEPGNTHQEELGISF